MTDVSVQNPDPEQDQRIKAALRASLEGQSDTYREWRGVNDSLFLSGTQRDMQRSISEMGWASRLDVRRMQYLALELEKRSLILFACALIGEALRNRGRWVSDDVLSTEFCIRNGRPRLMCDSIVKLSDADKARIVASTIKRIRDELDRENPQDKVVYDLVGIREFGGSDQLREFLTYCVDNDYAHMAKCITCVLDLKATKAA